MLQIIKLKFIGKNFNGVFFMAKNLVIFYSRRGQNYVNGEIVDLKRGNAELIAAYIQKALGADLFELETVEPYSLDYHTCTEEAKKEVREKARPKLKNQLTSLSDYENIFVVGPNWWGVYPMAIYTQLEALDFTNHHVHYVVTHEGSGLGGVPRTMKESCKGAILGESLAVQGSNAPRAEATVAQWAKNAVGI